MDAFGNSIDSVNGYLVSTENMPRTFPSADESAANQANSPPSRQSVMRETMGQYVSPTLPLCKQVAQRSVRQQSALRPSAGGSAPPSSLPFSGQ